MGSFFGPALGAAVLILLDRLITEFTEYWPTVLGIILIFVLFFLPDGLIGLFRRRSSETEEAGGEAPKAEAGDAVDNRSV